LGRKIREGNLLLTGLYAFNLARPPAKAKNTILDQSERLPFFSLRVSFL
jgi:hypothetical protein